MTLFAFVGLSHSGAISIKFGWIMYNIVQKPIDNGHRVPGTTVTVYLISFLTITAVFFSWGHILLSFLCSWAEHLIVTFCSQNWVTHFLFPIWITS